MMHNVSSGHTGTSTRAPKTRRYACDRCRRQKLKCDVEKPCSLCLRSGFDCVTANSPLR
ncbi:Zn(II)2Cys6 transcription factor domain-containing protein [Aspergillus alliaceus]|uniref:Zn(II)2Cys6 transcription factor domain-containing protein n=1 Tax=Petromyces alliaceus TaxID=209559 RepID=UPI0012A54C1D|nr:uncharacterized protein BDW43DRAFT_274505 [Aspergillus alliaceus]KAB8234178.1 hypothetical protein BDW43DRAFT_274505 [Aspergillus alliaceus]